jgi:hypothetical protein
MTIDNESMAKQFVRDFERGASYQEMMAKYHLTQQEVEILVEGLYPSTLTQQITLTDWRAQTKQDLQQNRDKSKPQKKSSFMDFFRRGSSREKTSISGFRKFFSKRK